MVKRLNKGFTLTELLIVLAILAILIVIVIGIINPISLTGRANDAERKRDLNMIKKTFEEYYNDHGEYPCDVSDWNIEDNCGKNLSQFKYLQPWPCDPFGYPYYISVDQAGCKSYRVLTNLEYTADKAIPDGWYDEDNELHRMDGYTPEDFNYGVGSGDEEWSRYSLGENCNGICAKKSLDGQCNGSTCNIEDGDEFCYADSECNEECRATCCGPSCP